MAEHEAGSRGPDLRQGVRAAEVPDGGMIAGHVASDAVLLVHRGNEWFAVGATCSHYSGPLAEGLVVGDTVRCPWHHACFDLRTGAALRPPALNDLPCWDVELRDGRVFVGVRREVAAARSATRRGRRSAIVIVGAGAAGDSAAETLRREGFGGSITMIDPDRDAPVRSPEPLQGLPRRHRRRGMDPAPSARVLPGTRHRAPARPAGRGDRRWRAGGSGWTTAPSLPLGCAAARHRRVARAAGA